MILSISLYCYINYVVLHISNSIMLCSENGYKLKVLVNEASYEIPVA